MLVEILYHREEEEEEDDAEGTKFFFNDHLPRNSIQKYNPEYM